MVTKKKAAIAEPVDSVSTPVVESQAEAAAEPKPEETPKAANTTKRDKAVKTAQAIETAKAVRPAKTVKAAKKVPAKASVNAAEVKAPAAKSKVAKALGEKKSKPAKAAKVAKPAKEPATSEKAKPAEKTKPVAAKTATVLDSQVAYEGKLFRVLRDHIIEPGGTESYKDVIKHNGSVVILAVDPGKTKKDPWIVIERQYRHAAGQFLWELPAGKLDGGEKPLDGAKRELAEETGYSAKKWTPLVEYFASPGFLGEAMKVFLAEGLVAGDAHPEEDEKIDFRLVKLSELLTMVDKGKIIDGKTLTSVLLYARTLGLKRKK